MHDWTSSNESRRRLIKAMALFGLAANAPFLEAFSGRFPVLRPIPSSGEKLPVIGMTAGKPFNTRLRDPAVKELQEVLVQFFSQGGLAVASSPTYVRAEKVLGDWLQSSGKKGFFSIGSTTEKKSEDVLQQFEQSLNHLGLNQHDLLIIDRVRSADTYTAIIESLKAQNKIRYAGISASEKSEKAVLEILDSVDGVDFLQLDYSVTNQWAEKALLPMAMDKGIAVLVKEPFRKGRLFRLLRKKELPNWAEEIACNSWAQILLKYVVSHPAVTCTVPDVASVPHVVDNMFAGLGPVPDAGVRRKIEQVFS